MAQGGAAPWSPSRCEICLGGHVSLVPRIPGDHERIEIAALETARTSAGELIEHEATLRAETIHRRLGHLEVSGRLIQCEPLIGHDCPPSLVPPPLYHSLSSWAILYLRLSIPIDR